MEPVYGGSRAHLRPPQLAVTPLPRGVDTAALKSILYDKHRIEIPLTGHGERRFVRVSVQGYNTEDDLQRLLDALVAEVGQ